MRNVVLLAMTLLVAGQANACGCSHPTFGDTSSVMQTADVVFVGEVQGVEIKTVNGIEEVHATFKVLYVKKGPTMPVITILVGGGGTSCYLPASFKIGERYLVSGHEVVWANAEAREARGLSEGEKVYDNSLCDLRELINVTPNTSLERTRGR